MRKNSAMFPLGLLEIVEDGTINAPYEELEALHYWFHADRFDSKGANLRLYDHAHGKDVFM